MPVTNMVEQPKTKDQLEKAKNGVDQYSKLKRIEWPNSMDGNKYENEFTKTICADNDKNIHALMALYKGIKDRNDNFCKKNNFDSDMFMITALIYGEGVAREKFLKGEDLLKDQRISEVKQLFVYYKGLSLDERNVIMGDSLSRSVETWAGHYFHAGAESDPDHRETNLAFAIITRWNNAREKNVFDNAENVAKWFGGKIGEDSQCFSHFPGGISGIKWATYAGLINPTLGGKPDLHKEIMTGAGREGQGAEKPTLAGATIAPTETKEPVTLARDPSTVAITPVQTSVGPQELTPGLKSDLEDLNATLKRMNEQEIADLGGCLSTISKRLEKYSDPDFVFLKGQVDDAINKLESGGKLDANAINAMRECVNIILGIENEPTSKEAAPVAPKTPADSVYTGPSLNKMPDQKVSPWALKMKDSDSTAKSGVDSTETEQKKSEKDQKIADQERDRKAEEDEAKRKADVKKYQGVIKEYDEVAENITSMLRKKTRSPKIEYQLANVKSWKDYIRGVDTDGGILESLILYGPLDQIAFLTDFAKNKAGYDAAKAKLVSGVVPEVEIKGTPYEGLINDLGDWLDSKKMDPKLMDKIRVWAAYLQSIDKNKDLVNSMAFLGPQPQYDLLERFAKDKVGYEKAKNDINDTITGEVPKAPLNAPVAPKDSSASQSVVSDSSKAVKSKAVKSAVEAPQESKAAEVTAYDELANELKDWLQQRVKSPAITELLANDMAEVRDLVNELKRIDQNKTLLNYILKLNPVDQLSNLEMIGELELSFKDAEASLKDALAPKDSTRQAVAKDSSTAAKPALQDSSMAVTTEVSQYEELAARLKIWSNKKELQSEKVEYQTENVENFVAYLKEIDTDKTLLPDILKMKPQVQMTTLQNIYETKYTSDGARNYIDFVK
ncbi:MAG: hypothetical protein V1909_00970 [Candidatus Micrarchaeota archaeon]